MKPSEASEIIGALWDQHVDVLVDDWADGINYSIENAYLHLIK